MATYAEAELARIEGEHSLGQFGTLEDIVVIYDSPVESYFLKAIFAPHTLKGSLKDPVKINNVRVIVEERKVGGGSPVREEPEEKSRPQENPEEKAQADESE